MHPKLGEAGDEGHSLVRGEAITVEVPVGYVVGDAVVLLILPDSVEHLILKGTNWRNPWLRQKSIKESLKKKSILQNIRLLKPQTIQIR